MQESQVPGVGSGRTDEYQVELSPYIILASLMKFPPPLSLTSSFCLTGLTGGVITQTQMQLSMLWTAVTVTGWVSQSLSWWPCWR